MFYCGDATTYPRSFDATEDCIPSEALEIAMKLEASLVGENGAGMMQV